MDPIPRHLNLIPREALRGSMIWGPGFSRREVKDSKLVLPQLWYRLGLDRATIDRMLAFPSRVLLGPQVISPENSPETHPMFFGLNHLEWWIGLIQRDVAFLGVDAILAGGQILFGRFQNTAEEQNTVEHSLREIVKKVDMWVHIEKPSTEHWWRGLWERGLEHPHAVDLRSLATILQAVRQEDPLRANDWLDELAEKNFDQSEVVATLALEAPFAYSVDSFWIRYEQTFQDMFREENLEGINQLLEELFLYVSQLPLEEAVGRMICLKQIVDGLEIVPLKVGRAPIHSRREFERRWLELIKEKELSFLPSRDGVSQYVDSVSKLAFLVRALGEEEWAGKLFVHASGMFNPLSRPTSSYRSLGSPLDENTTLRVSPDIQEIVEAREKGSWRSKQKRPEELALFLKGNWEALLTLMEKKINERGQEALDEMVDFVCMLIPKENPSAPKPSSLLPDFSGYLSLFSEEALDFIPPNYLASSNVSEPPGDLPDYFSLLPVRAPEAFPKNYLAFIPHPSRKVIFPRFQRILNEVSSLVMSPHRVAIRLFGPPGTAKTTIPEMVASAMETPLFRFPFSRRVGVHDLEGQWTQEVIAGKLVTVYKEGIMTLCMEYGFHLVLDEPDTARPGVIAFLNNVIDPGNHAWVRKQSGDLVKIPVHLRYQVWITENGAGQIDREEHGRDFLRRTASLYIGSWSPVEVAQVIAELYEREGSHQRWSRKVTEILALCHDKMRFLANGYVDPANHQSLAPLGTGVGQRVDFTPRSILRVAQRLAAEGELTPESLSRALRAEYILPLADPHDRELVWIQLQAMTRDIGREMNWSVLESIGPAAIPDPTENSISQKYLGGAKFPKGRFVWTTHVLRLLDEILWNRSLGIDVLLLGDSGEGKTKLAPQIAALLGLEYYTKTMSRQTCIDDLVGGPAKNIRGDIVFKQDIVYAATQRGGICHLDEYLLGQSSQLEEVMNPLMDDARALILKSPFLVVPRHPDTYFILTSNPSFGGFAERNEQSVAAMSRVASIHLTGDFAMGPGDKVEIVSSWISQPFSPTDKKKDLTPPPDAGTRQNLGLFFRGSLDPETDEKKDPRFYPVLVHPDNVERFGIPSRLVVDLQDKKILQGEKEDLRELSPETSRSLQRMCDYLTRRTKVEVVPLTRMVFKISYGMFKGHSTNLTSLEINLSILGLLHYPLLASLGVGKHEWAHATIDRPHAKYDATEEGRLFANAVGDPRMNEFISSLREDFKEQIRVMFDAGNPPRLTRKQVADWQSQLPHEQFVFGLLYEWRHGKIPGWVVEEPILEALRQALPLLRPVYTLFPKVIQKIYIDKTAGEFYEALDRAWPYYEKLLPLSRDQLKQRFKEGHPLSSLADPLGMMGKINAFSLLVKGDPQEGDGQPLLDPELDLLKASAMGEEALETTAAFILSRRAGKLADQFEPNDPLQFGKRKKQIAQAVLVYRNRGAGEEEPSHLLPSQGVHRVDYDPSQPENALVEAPIPNLFTIYLPSQALQAAQRLKRIVPPTVPEFMEGYFTSGPVMDRRMAVQDSIRPVPTNKVMLRRLEEGKHDAAMMIVSDVSGSIRMAGGVDNSLRSSATAMYLSESLDIHYGEYVFESHVRPIHGLGRPMNSYKKKNEILNKKKEALQKGGATNIRAAIEAGLAAIRRRKAETNFLILITDGDENISHEALTLPEIEANAEKENIRLVVLAIGDAQRYVPRYFKRYRFVADDGADIPDRIIELIEEIQNHRFRSGYR